LVFKDIIYGTLEYTLCIFWAIRQSGKVKFSISHRKCFFFYIPFRKQDLVKFRFKVQGCKNPSLPQIRRLKDDATFGIMYLSSTVFKLSFRKAITNLLFEFPFSSVPFLSITQTSTIPPLTKHLSPYLRNSLRQWGTDTVLSIWAGRLRYVLWL